MTKTSQSLLAVGYLAILAGLGISDAMLTAGMTIYPHDVYKVQVVETGVSRQRDPDVFGALQALQITTSPTEQRSLLSRIVPEQVPLTSRVLFQNNEGIGFFAYVQSADVRAYFTALKDALHQSFSKDVRDLVDTMEAPTDHPVRNILSFVDPALSDDKIILVRVRERLYEFHVPLEKEPIILSLIDKLTE